MEENIPFWKQLEQQGKTLVENDGPQKKSENTGEEKKDGKSSSCLVPIKIKPSTSDRIRRHLASEYLRTGKNTRIADFMEMVVDSYFDSH